MAVPTPRQQRILGGSAATLAGLVVIGWMLWTFALTSPESRQVGAFLDTWYGHHQAGEILECSLEADISAELPPMPIQLRWKAPDHLKLQTEIEEVAATMCRNGEELWIHVPEKQYALVGQPDLPRFTGYPDSVEAVELPSLDLPVSRWQMRLAPMLLKVNTSDEGALTIAPSDLGRKLANLPEFQAELSKSAEQGEGYDRFRLAIPGSTEIEGEIRNWGKAEDVSVEEWTLQAPEEHVVEEVALAHLVRCLQTLPSQLASSIPTLPEATGQREVISTSGKGRLELHDGVRVLFLEGTPEELGQQHGELLRDEVRRMTEQILYGVGVASSFEKQRWFIGEIEEAQERVQPFVTDEHLREMDALAAATDLHIQEARLTNFFPELFHCSGFAIHGKATIDGQMYHGRILDYMRGVGLEQNAVVMVCQPEGKNAWVNIGYAGFLGSVTAMNEKQIAIGEMGGRGEGDWDGKPMAQLVREVMEQCDTIDEAVEHMRNTPRTCEYYYVISDAKSMRAVGIKATPDIFETIWSGESHPQLTDPVEDTVLLSAENRYKELVRRVKEGYGTFGPDQARDLMTRPVCMTSNIQSVLFAPGTLDFWVANADSENVASHTRYTHFNLAHLLGSDDS